MRGILGSVALAAMALVWNASASGQSLPALGGAVQVTSGLLHTCALSSAGAVRCWGSNREGQLGTRDAAGNQRETPVDVLGLGSGVAAISAGQRHTCALLQSGEVRCWGANDSGQLGDGSTQQRSQPVVVALGGAASAISAGEAHTCAVVAGALRCWGRNESGQLGVDDFTARVQPAAVPALSSGVTAVAAGHDHTCALRSGAALCWGNNQSGQLGDGQFGLRPVPGPVSTLGSGVVGIAVGRFHSCALVSGGAVRCWGGNSVGQLGRGGFQESRTPVAVPGLDAGVRQVVANFQHACALLGNGGVQCWGDNFYGQIGDGTSLTRDRPTAVTGLGAGQAALGAGYLHGCAVGADGRVRCWGNNFDGQLGNGEFTNRLLPRRVVGLGGGIERIGTGFQHSCAWSAAGGTRCWGDNTFGQLGNGDNAVSEVPVAVQQLADGSGVLDGGVFHTCSLTASGGVKCWGQNSFGQLGDGSTTDRNLPVAVSGLSSGVTALATGGFHTCALLGGGLRCWGSNAFGQLGIGVTGDISVPTEVGGLPGALSSVSAGEAHTCALTQSGGVLCWGANAVGQLGDGTLDARAQPTPVSGLGSGVRAISVSGNFSCALLHSGGVRCWGGAESGQLGEGGTISRRTPTQVLGLSDGVVAIEAAWYHACAIDGAGGLSCWGRNTEGQLGDNSVRPRFLPRPVAGLGRGVLQNSGGGGQNCVLRQGGEVFCWGANNFGQIGDGSSWAVRTPVDVLLAEARRDVATLVPGANAPSSTVASDKSGRFVAFASSASNLVGGDANGARDVFRRDRQTGALVRVSLANSGAQLSGDAGEPAISGDGQRIVFVAPDAAVADVLGESGKARAQRLKNTGQGLFLRNMLTGTTQRVGDAQPQSSAAPPTAPTVSGNGGSIAWTQPVSDPAQGSVGQSNIYIAAATPSAGGAVALSQPVCVTCRVPGAGGQPTSALADGGSRNPSLSEDGRWLAFETDATNFDLGGGGKNAPCAGATTIVLRDMLTGSTRAASAPASGGSCGGGSAPAAQPAVSGDGSSVVFQTGQSLVPGDGNGESDIYLWNATTGSLTRVSAGEGGLDANGASTSPSISADGSSVAFVSAASNLDASFGDNNDQPDVHVARLGDGVQVARLSLSDAGGEAGRESAAPVISGDGNRIAFESAAGNLAPGAVDNQLGVFQRANPLAGGRDRSGVWWTPSESGWGLVTADQGEALVLGWFTYDTDGEPMWLSGAMAPQADGSYRGDLFRNTGVPLAQISGVASESTTLFAQGQIRFDGERALRFDYSLANGPSQSKQMERFPFGAQELVCPPGTPEERLAADNYSDIWWGGAQTSGWGLFLTQIDALMFPVWFTYDVDREPVFYTGIGERQADGSFAGPLVRSRNGTPLAQIDGMPASSGTDIVGSFGFTPTNGISGDFAYVLGATSQSKRIERFAFGSAAPLCRTRAATR